MKSLMKKKGPQATHWVGDGFPVKSTFSYARSAQELSPFLMLDYAAPYQFDSTDKRRGVGAHPHRGFETVTIVYQGELEHRDSTGGGGVIGPGEVQWMTAGNGIIHEEYHSERFAKEGGTLEMVQLWVNLRAKDKSAPAGYQTLSKFPIVELPGGAGSARIIAGQYSDHSGPATTFDEINLWDLDLKAGKEVALPVPEGATTVALVLRGQLEGVTPGGLLSWSREGKGVLLKAQEDVKILLMSGEPFGEPVVGHGPFVMNTQKEIAESFELFRQGSFGQVA